MRFAGWLIYFLTSYSQLYRVEEGKEDVLVAAYHRGHLVINVRKPFIELFDGYEEILDLLVGTPFCT